MLSNLKVSQGKYVALRYNGIPSPKLKEVESQKKIIMTKDLYKCDAGPAFPNKPLIKIEERYPKVSSMPKEIDGTDGVNTNKKALTIGLYTEALGQKVWDYAGCIKQPHPIWTKEECDSVEITHVRPKGFAQRAAYCTVWALRRAYDVGTGYSFKKTEASILRRIIILETVAGIPGMVGAFVRHMRSLRKGEPDYGWIHSLLEEAENERMHLMIAMQMRDLGLIVRSVVFAAQAIVLPFYFSMYCVSPKYCHSFVGYLEEEAVKTYTAVLELIDQGKLPGLHMTAHQAAADYYHLPEGATFRDIITNIRADEAHHRHLNHCLAHLKHNEPNPFPPGF